MSCKCFLLLIPLCALIAADDPPTLTSVPAAASTPAPTPAWSTKKVAEWSDDDAKQVLADSPWTKSITPSIVRGSPSNYNNNNGGIGRGGGVGIGIPGMGYPGGGRRGGGGGGGNRYPGSGTGNPAPRSSDSSDQQAPKLTLRWESAMPVREAELKTRDANAPTLEDETHYAFAVYGIPANMLNGDAKQLADACKKKTTLSRDGKKDLKPSSVQILRREDGPVVLFLFLHPKGNEVITKDDRRVEFDTQINKLSVTQSFYLEDMLFQGKTEL